MSTTIQNPGTVSRYQTMQFSLASMFEYLTWCAAILALSALLGVPATVFLMLLVIAIAARKGELALAMFVAATLTAMVTGDSQNGALMVIRPFLAAAVTLVVCVRFTWGRDIWATVRRRAKL